jgi:hypothetical protein
LEGVSAQEDSILDFFNMPKERMEYYLRTKTAIGSTKKRFNKGVLKIRVSLSIYDDTVSEEENIEIVPEYLFLDTLFEKKDVVDITQFEKEAVKLDDRQKIKRLKDKCFKIEGDNGKYKYFFFFVPSTESWRKISEERGLFFSDEIKDVTNFLTVSTKGMPTGFEIPRLTGYAAGYWSNLFVIIEYDNIKFDIGRKYINPMALKPIKELIRDNFKTLTHWKQFVAKSNDPSPIPAGRATSSLKDAEFERISNEVSDLNFPTINYLKTPDYQEAAVSAIFHELLGAKILKGYFGLREGYVQQYDFLGKYEIDASDLGINVQKGITTINQYITIEYKYEAASIISDIDNNIKRFDDVDLLVCWTINRDEFKKSGIQVEPIKVDDVFYYGSNYELDLGNGSRKIVIALKEFIDDYKKTH